MNALERGLEQSDSVALVVSPESRASGWVEEEYNRAVALTMRKNQPLRLIPVLLRTAELPGFLASREPVDFRDAGQYARSMWRLVWGITGKQSAEALDLDANALPPLPGEHVPEPAPLPRRSRMHMRRNPQFVGRTDQLRALARALQVDGRAVIGQVASVTGLGGIGKTQLAAEFVHRYGQTSGTVDEATLDAICAELGDLPLALHLAGSFLACYRDTTTPAAYLAELRNQALLEHESLQGDGAETSPTGHVLHVGRTFALSWERLDPADAVDAIARDLLQRAACLAPGEPIPHALLVATLSTPEDNRAARTQAKALRRLLDLGLLEKPEPATYRIHRLVTAFARHTGGDHDAARAAVEQTMLHEARRVNASGYPARLLPW
jgi:hypothetical protein